MINSFLGLRIRRSIVSIAPLPCLIVLGLFGTPLLAQQPRAILADGSGPWRDARWAFTVSQFSGLLTDAGYSVTTVSPVDLPSALGSPDILLVIPSLESLPFDAFTAIAAHVGTGGGLMASGGEPLDRKSTRLNSSHLGISYA